MHGPLFSVVNCSGSKEAYYCQAMEDFRLGTPYNSIEGPLIFPSCV